MSSFRIYQKNVPQYLSKREFDALKNFPQNKHIIIRKSVSGSSIAIVDIDKYIKDMDNFLGDQSQFQKITVKADHLSKI